MASRERSRYKEEESDLHARARITVDLDAHSHLVTHEPNLRSNINMDNTRGGDQR